MRLYGVYMRCSGVLWRVYGVLWRTMAVYIVGYTVMAYGLGLWSRRVGVACVVGCVYGVYPLGCTV